MNGTLPTYSKKGICRDCGIIFEKKAQNQNHCPDCSAWRKIGARSLSGKISLAAPRLQKAADESGNPVIWRRGDPVEKLPQGMRKRVETAMRFGV